jgi:multicomponent Na+:H+ antiporter subunit D
MRTGLYPREMPSVNLDTDWIYRRLLPATLNGVQHWLVRTRDRVGLQVRRRLDAFFSGVYRHYGPESVLARSWATSTSVLWILVLLLIFLVIYYA